MIQNIKVSILMNCLNGFEFLHLSVPTIISQTHTNWELIFWDNNSSDESANHPVLKDPRIRIFRSEQTVCLGAARRLAMQKVTGDWIAFLDVDDEWLPEKLETQLRGIDDSETVMTYGGIQEIDKNGSLIREVIPKWSSGEQLANQLSYFEINLVTAMLNRRALEAARLSFSSEIHASEEYHLFMRFLPYGKVKVEKRVIARYRVYPESLTYRKVEKWATERRMTLHDLSQSFPEVRSLKEYFEAHRQADYYEAAYLMSLHKRSEARQLLKKHLRAKLYFTLYLLTYSKM